MTRYNFTYHALGHTWTDQYLDKDYLSPLFYKDIENEYKTLKSEIFEAYEPEALAHKLAQTEIKPVVINDRRTYDWDIILTNNRLKLAFIAPGRPDCLKIEVKMRVKVAAKYSEYNHHPLISTSRSFKEVADVLKSSFCEAIKSFSMNFECVDAQGTLGVIGGIDHTLEMAVQAEFILKEIPNLEKVKFLEYNLPKVVYKEMCDISESLVKINR